MPRSRQERELLEPEGALCVDAHPVLQLEVLRDRVDRVEAVVPHEPASVEVDGGGQRESQEGARIDGVARKEP